MSMKNHEKFKGKAEVYSKYRPDYPIEYVRYLIDSNCLGADSKIADIGSGTGILTRQLLQEQLIVIGVEPNDEMRQIAEESLQNEANFISINATEQQTGIESNSLDLVTVAQAFHWFNHVAFKKECQRILKISAKVALVWNSRDLNSQIVLENAEICKKFCPNFNGFSGGIEETPDIYAKFFRDDQYEYREFRNDLAFTLEGFIGRNLSASYAPKPGQPNYSLFIKALTEQFYCYADEEMVIFPKVTKSYVGQV